MEVALTLPFLTASAWYKAAIGSPVLPPTGHSEHSFAYTVQCALDVNRVFRFQTLNVTETSNLDSLSV